MTKIRLALIVCRDGRLESVPTTVNKNGIVTSYEQLALGWTPKESIDSGFRIVFVEVEIDVDEIFSVGLVKGEVTT